MAFLSTFMRAAMAPAAAAPAGAAWRPAEAPAPAPAPMPVVCSMLARASSIQLGSGDVFVRPAAAPAEAAEAAAAPAAPASRKRDAYGSAVERWGDRAQRSTIAEQIALGCRCGCVDSSANMSDIVAARMLQARKTSAERRAFMRGAAEGGLVIDSSKSIGYALNWGDASRPACVTGFALRHGFADSWVYAMLREMKASASARALLVRARAHGVVRAHGV